jgi:transcriptional regulator, GntR family
VDPKNDHSKVFIDILEKIERMIEENHWKPGDKLPSERELAERLGVGRSSVREALRSMEFLGLISTRRGEGTFIADFRDHRLVEILGRFLLRTESSRSDVRRTKACIEQAALLS